MNIINFDAESVPLSVFNINPCFVNNRAVISIKVKGELDFLFISFIIIIIY